MFISFTCYFLEVVYRVYGDLDLLYLYSRGGMLLSWELGSAGQKGGGDGGTQRKI
jgi:hypothetical protein